jgi:hypothetical protein
MKTYRVVLEREVTHTESTSLIITIADHEDITDIANAFCSDEEFDELDSDEQESDTYRPELDDLQWEKQDRMGNWSDDPSLDSYTEIGTLSRIEGFPNFLTPAATREAAAIEQERKEHKQIPPLGDPE